MTLLYFGETATSAFILRKASLQSRKDILDWTKINAKNPVVVKLGGKISVYNALNVWAASTKFKACDTF